jgi:hypothetical protein
MASVMSASPVNGAPTFVDVVRPKEHGSWSLVLEPIVFGLIVAPTVAGLALCLSVLAAFFGRRPLRMVVLDRDSTRRRVAFRAVAVCGVAALVAFGVAVALGGAGWLPWLLPTALGGAAFLAFDLRQSGRDQIAELAGSCAFAFLSAAIAALAGFSFAAGLAVGLVMLARALPTVLVVRATVRARKTHEKPSLMPLAVAIVAAAAAVFLARADLAPRIAIVATLVLALRAFVFLAFPRPALRASTIGMIEALLGAAYVLTLGLAW